MSTIPLSDTFIVLSSRGIKNICYKIDAFISDKKTKTDSAHFIIFQMKYIILSYIMVLLFVCIVCSKMILGTCGRRKDVVNIRRDADSEVI